VISAVSMIAVLSVAALVIDVGRARSTARSLQSTADLAVLAAGPELGGGDAGAACRVVVGYVRTNLPEMASIDPATFCAQPGNDVDSTICDPPATGAQAAPTATAGRYTITLHYPVTDAELADGTISAPRINDGTPCERMRILLTSDDRTFFAGVLGIRSLVPRRSATARAVTGEGTRTPALWLLDPKGCVALSVSGGSRVAVGSGGAVPVPGVIAVDSDGSNCSSNQVTVSSSGAGTTLTALPTTGSPSGVISLHALARGATTCSPPACSPSDVSEGRLAPQPRRAPARATRAPVDWKYNCKSAYPDFHGIEVAGCPDPNPAYIDLLTAAVGASGSPGPSYTRWKSVYSCNPSGTVTVAGNWWIDCPGGLSIGNGTSVSFTGGNVVFDGGLTMTGGSLSFNTANPTATLPTGCLAPTVTTPCTGNSSAAAAFVLVRTGDWNLTGGQLVSRHSVIVQLDGYAKVNTGVPPSWVAPSEGPFEGLAFWSPKSSNKFSMNGGSGLDLVGVFFTPEAVPFSLAGGGVWGQQRAQFISYQLAVSGGGSLTLVPDTNAVTLPPMSAELIR
jgi:hypothetical protein